MSMPLSPTTLSRCLRFARKTRFCCIPFRNISGLSTPQQVQMALLALFGLMDEDDAYKQAIKRTIRRRHEALYRELGFEVPGDPNVIDYYTILDLEVLGARRYGRDFVDWLLCNKNPLEILFRLANEGGVVLLPGKGFGTPHPSARVSPANLNEVDYARIGRIIQDDYAGIRRRISNRQGGCRADRGLAPGPFASVEIYLSL